ncbi:MAG: GNAT family N-acetyltransferase [Acidimicrobiales bacterium]
MGSADQSFHAGGAGKKTTSLDNSTHLMFDETSAVPCDRPLTASILESDLRAGNGVIPPMLATRRVRLRPPSPVDLPALYGIAISDEVFWRWRYGGAIPTYDAFCSSFAAGVLTQFIVCTPSGRDILGLVVAYNADIANSTGYVAVMMRPSMLRTGIGAEAMFLFLVYLFKTWDFHKLYFEVLEFNVEQFASGIGKYFHEEGCYRDHHYYDGKRWNQHVFGLYRDEFLSHPTVKHYERHLIDQADSGFNGDRAREAVDALGPDPLTTT